MDLLTCPTCKQSVLDEDAAECPFCGSPMKAGAPPARPTASGSRGTGAKAGTGAAKPAGQSG
ncbi:MAG: hypothetical protein NT069_28540, partial [Planctomycetota bacterium]|nr:hypothetical protein [Planctomycetota bacterium]